RGGRAARTARVRRGSRFVAYPSSQGAGRPLAGCRLQDWSRAATVHGVCRLPARREHRDGRGRGSCSVPGASAPERRPGPAARMAAEPEPRSGPAARVAAPGPFPTTGGSAMDELVSRISQSTGIPEEAARKAVEMVLTEVRERLPAALASDLDQRLGLAPRAPVIGGAESVVKNLADRFGVPE